MNYHPIGTWVEVHAVATPILSETRRIVVSERCEPFRGQVVGLRRVYDGELDRTKHKVLTPTSSAVVYLVRRGMINAPIPVFPIDLHQISGRFRLPLKFTNLRWSPADRAIISAAAREQWQKKGRRGPRGRFAKCP